MAQQGFDVSKKKIEVRMMDYARWPMTGWDVTKPPWRYILNFVARGIQDRRRPFIILDHAGMLREVRAVVNARCSTIRPRDRRLFVIYTYVEEGREVASWGELIFLDAGDRVPPIERYDLRTRWIAYKERHWPRKVEVKKAMVDTSKPMM